MTTRDNNVVPIRSLQRAPERRDSGLTAISPVEIRRRAFAELTTAAGRAYDAAAHHRRTGDTAGAGLLIETAGALLAQARVIGEELARLA